MSTMAMRAMTSIPGISAPVARLRHSAGVTPETFPEVRVSTSWSEMTGFSVRHY